MQGNTPRDVPNRNNSLIAAASQLRAVRAPSHLVNGARKRKPISDALAAVHTPNLYASTFVRGKETAAIRHKGKRARAPVSIEVTLVLLYIPNPKRGHACCRK
jgi:hypothetical protein